jgi:phage terminase large subunit-like protein
MASYVDRANRYARDVVSGKIPNCRWVKYAAKRHLDDLARQKHKDFPYRFDVAAAEKPCEFIEELPHVKGKWARKKQKIRLGDWQCFIVCVLFGWLKKKNGMRRFRRAYIRMPRKNGKSMLAAIIGLYMWCMDGETGRRSTRARRPRSKRGRSSAPRSWMLEKTEDCWSSWAAGLDVGEGARVAPSATSRASSRSSASRVMAPRPRARSRTSTTSTTPPISYDTMETGMLAREQPHTAQVITTAGYNLAGPCYDLDLDAQKILEGTMPAERLVRVMYGIDESVLMERRRRYKATTGP